MYNTPLYHNGMYSTVPKGMYCTLLYKKGHKYRRMYVTGTFGGDKMTDLGNKNHGPLGYLYCTYCTFVQVYKYGSTEYEELGSAGKDTGPHCQHPLFLESFTTVYIWGGYNYGGGTPYKEHLLRTLLN